MAWCMLTMKWLLLMLFWMTSCHGNDPISHLVLLDSLPAGIAINSTPEIVVRTNYSGVIEFREADKFQVLINITAPSIDQAYAVHTKLVGKDGKLLLQLYEKPPSSTDHDVTLPWLFLSIGIATAVVMLWTTGYAIWWYSKQKFMENIDSCHGYYDPSQQPMIYRSRNSMHLSTQPGEMPVCAEEDHDNMNNEDTLRQVPEMPEEEELAEAMQMEQLQAQQEEREPEEDPNLSSDDRQYIRNRYQSSSKTIHKELSRKDKAFQRIKKKSNDDPPSYSSVMAYPDQSSEGSEGSDEEQSASRVEAKDSENKYIYDKNQLYISQNGKPMSSFMSQAGKSGRNFDLNLTSCRSDGDLLRNDAKPSDKLKNLPPTARGLVTPTAGSSTLQQGELMRVEKLDNCNLDTSENSNVKEVDPSPFMVTALVHQPDSQTPDESHVKGAKAAGGQKVTVPGHRGFWVSSSDSHPMDIPLTTFKMPQYESATGAVGDMASSHPKPGDSGDDQASKYIWGEQEPPRYYMNTTRMSSRESTLEPKTPDTPDLLNESGRSMSLYGSGEIFTQQQQLGLFHDGDNSDVDPMDSDVDVLSDYSLPSPPAAGRPPNPFSVPESDVQKARPVCYAPTNPFAQPLTGVYIAATASPSTTFTPGNTQQSGNLYQNAGNPTADNTNVGSSLYGFPPPSNLYRSPWNPEDTTGGGDYVQFPPPPIPEDTAGEEEHEEEEAGRGVRGGGGVPLGYRHLPLTVVMSLCILSLVTGVICKLAASDDTTVHVTVFAPANFLTRNISVFTSDQKVGDVVGAVDNMVWYELTNPILWNINSFLCTNHTCEQGCDENTGQCICEKGYKLDSAAKCVDVNECMEGGARCHERAGCLNIRGSYLCICSGDYYGDGKSCSECAAPCREGMYEIQPCLRTAGKQKICNECTMSCRPGDYMLKSCSEFSNAVCRMCLPMCPLGQYEYTRCSGAHNRVCNSKSELSAPDYSKNVILEDRLSPVDQKEVFLYLPSDFRGIKRFTFQRAFGVYIDVAVKHLNPVGMFDPVDHSDKNDLLSYKGPEEILETYCPYPVPFHYELSRTILKDVTYQIGPGKTIQPCRTHIQYGNFPNFSQSETPPVLCAEPVPLTCNFYVDSEFAATSTVWAEISPSCATRHEACENCTRHCARSMFGGNNDCSLTNGEEADNGYSPRLPTCYSCCAKKNCSTECRDYHQGACQPRRCHKGTLIQFDLKPVFLDHNQFLCHVYPQEGQHLLTLEYKVMHHHRKLLQGSLGIHSDPNWQQTGKSLKRDGIISVDIDAKLNKVPNLVIGELGSPNFKVGVYSDKGDALKHTVFKAPMTFIRPTNPFGINPSTFGKMSCSDQMLQDAVTSDSSELQEPYTPMQDLLALYLGNTSYIITNKTLAPVVSIGIDKDVSIMKAIFPLAELDLNSVTTNITQNASHWILGVKGMIKSCPGSFDISVSDPGYPEEPLFHYDVGIRCKTNRVFRLTFYIPTGDQLGMEKDLRVSIQDNTTTYHLTLHKPAMATVSTANVTQNTSSEDVTLKPSPPAAQRDSISQAPHFSIPFIAGVSGAIVLLVFMAAFGLAVRPGIPMGDILKFRCYHLLLLIGYITFQFLFAVVVSMTVFVLIVMAVNSNTAAFLQQYHQQRSVRTALSQLELDQMRQHMVTEIARQNYESNNTKHPCDMDMKKVISDINTLRQEIESETRHEIQKQSIPVLVNQHMRQVLQQFTDQLHAFQEHYDSYVNYTIRKLSADVEQTYKSLENNKWLAGARFLHGSYANFRKHLQNLSAKPFITWAGLEMDISKLTASVSNPSLPSLPRFEDILLDGASNHRTRHHREATNNLPIKPNIVETHNFWVFPKSSHKSSEQSNSTKNKDKSQSTLSVQPHFRFYRVMFILMVVIDGVWLLHRMLKALGVGYLLLYGFPVYVDLRNKPNPDLPSVDDAHKKSNCFKSQCCEALKYFGGKVTSTLFIPKLIATIFVCLFVYMVSMTADKFVNRETFSYLGYYNNMDDLLKLNEAIINSRIKAHAQRINSLDYPVHEQLVNSYVERHQFLLSMIDAKWQGTRESHRDLYCRYLRGLDLKANCPAAMPAEGTHQKIKFAGCQFNPVKPKLYYRINHTHTTIAEVQMDAFLASIRNIISDTCYLILIYLSIIVIKELVGTVAWVYIKRSGLFNLRVIYETDDARPVQ